MILMEDLIQYNSSGCVLATSVTKYFHLLRPLCEVPFTPKVLKIIFNPNNLIKFSNVILR
jgi:hypothetical protein